MDPYSVLGVARDAPISQIRQAYVALARRSHPDVRGGAQAAGEEMRRINQAWAMLSDAKSRAEVDRRLRTKQSQPLWNQHSRPRPTSQNPNARSYGTSSQGASSASNDFTANGYNDAYQHATEDFHEDAFEGDDGPLTPAELPSWLALGMPLAFVIGIFGVIIGAMTGGIVLVRFGVLLLVAAAMMFALSPFVVLIRSKAQQRTHRAK